MPCNSLQIYNTHTYIYIYTITPATLHFQFLQRASKKCYSLCQIGEVEVNETKHGYGSHKDHGEDDEGRGATLLHIILSIELTAQLGEFIGALCTHTYYNIMYNSLLQF